MSLHNNPFVRGYWDLYAQRLLSIVCKGNQIALLSRRRPRLSMP